MSFKEKTTLSLRQRKIARKKVFAEFVASRQVTCNELKRTYSEYCPQAIVSVKAETCIVPPHFEQATTRDKSTQIGIVRKRKRSHESQVGITSSEKVEKLWQCCNKNYSELLEIHKHVATNHWCEIDKRTDARLLVIGAMKTSDTKQRHLFDGDPVANKSNEYLDKRAKSSKFSGTYSNSSILPWLPSGECNQVDDNEEGEILLYYKYVDVEDPVDICEWQKELCRRLRLNGKVRVASEGINGTVGGNQIATQLYMTAVKCHPLFKNIDFKTSKGSAADFPRGLCVAIHSEIVPMGIEPAKLSYHQAGINTSVSGFPDGFKNDRRSYLKSSFFPIFDPDSEYGGHLSIDEFHKELQTHQSQNNLSPSTNNNNTVYVDCRNFYESRIGQFPGAILPDIRKFSYWPEYIDKNLETFKDKRVVMYCTGGIRCERGSAYLKSKGVCKDVQQLSGGIHRYMDKYPNGFFKGKLFVFDDRYSIASNDTIISNCFYCTKLWDKYQPCSSPHCHQLVLSCPECRGQGSTACCNSCKEISSKAENSSQRVKEECNCTRGRVRIPQETKQQDTVS